MPIVLLILLWLLATRKSRNGIRRPKIGFYELYTVDTIIFGDDDVRKLVLRCLGRLMYVITNNILFAYWWPIVY